MITLSQVSLRRGTKELFSNATCQLPAGSKVGLVGRNGSGKSSLLDALLGRLTVDAGDIQVPRGARTAVLRQEIPATDLSLIHI